MDSQNKNQKQGEVKHVKSRAGGGAPPRDPSLRGGERGSSPEENRQVKKEKSKPAEPPIIEKDVT